MLLAGHGRFREILKQQGRIPSFGESDSIDIKAVSAQSANELRRCRAYLAAWFWLLHHSTSKFASLHASAAQPNALSREIQVGFD
jgi:hypothetical protein